MAFAIINGMELTIDRAGRIIVPKSVRDRLGFAPEAAIEATLREDGVLLRRAEQRPSMIKVDGMWVHQGTPEPGVDWSKVVNDVREERVSSFLK